MPKEPKPVVIGARVRDAQLLDRQRWVGGAQRTDHLVDIAIHVHPPNDLRFSCGAAAAA
jgi:hypothetical protein